MQKGLLIRGIVIAVGIVPLAIFLHVINAPPGVPGSAVILYAIVGGNYFGYYLTEHADEIFTDSTEADQR